ncbi:WHG domain-containing protein [Micromonospora sp. NPDC047644]|uniref:WHG domain-containing protein n=1 Tax=Micromonospora sp. NPDC047644 TaxID=3157203 RepID=UPI0034549E89
MTATGDPALALPGEKRIGHGAARKDGRSFDEPSGLLGRRLPRWRAAAAASAATTISAAKTGCMRTLADCVAAGRSTSVGPFGDATALWVGLHGFAQLRVAAPLFPWPAEVRDSIIDRMALLR